MSTIRKLSKLLKMLLVEMGLLLSEGFGCISRYGASKLKNIVES